MRILISNDDGVFSPGIRTLAEIASAFGEVRIVAPDGERSASSQSITSNRPMFYKRTVVGDIEAFRVDGTPADSVALGMHNWEKVDVVLSGINLGYNLGNAMWHSGTLAAAKQAVLLGARAIALSAKAFETEAQYAPVRASAKQVLDLLLHDAAGPRLVNVNIPEVSRGMVWTRQSVRQYDGKVIPTKDPYGRNLFWFVAQPLQEVEPGTDRWAIKEGFISLTPLRLDLTSDAELDLLRARAQTATAHAATAASVKATSASIQRSGS